MEVKNGIIIDGVLHEGLDECETINSCDSCSLYKAERCNGACDLLRVVRFVNRGKVKVEKVRTLKTCIKDKNKICNLCHECDVCISNPTCSNY